MFVGPLITGLPEPPQRFSGWFQTHTDANPVNSRHTHLERIWTWLIPLFPPQTSYEAAGLMRLQQSWCLRIRRWMISWGIYGVHPPNTLLRDCTMMVNILLTRPYFGETWHWRVDGPLRFPWFRGSHDLDMVGQKVNSEPQTFPNGTSMDPYIPIIIGFTSEAFPPSSLM